MAVGTLAVMAVLVQDDAAPTLEPRTLATPAPCEDPNLVPFKVMLSASLAALEINGVVMDVI